MPLGTESSRIYLTKPEGNRVHRQISRMIKHLRDQYCLQHPTTAMPSSWLIEQLVINGTKSHIVLKPDWQDRVQMTLEQIIRDTEKEESCFYVNSRNNMPLFPNNELFDAWEVHQSMKILLESLLDNQS